MTDYQQNVKQLFNIANTQIWIQHHGCVLLLLLMGPKEQQIIMRRENLITELNKKAFSFLVTVQCVLQNHFFVFDGSRSNTVLSYLICTTCLQLYRFCVQSYSIHHGIFLQYNYYFVSKIGSIEMHRVVNICAILTYYRL